MKSLAHILLVAGLSIILHILPGWGWTALAGIGGGLLSRRLGWLIGLIGVALGWSALVMYNFTVAPDATSEMARIFSSLLGNLPAVVTVAATVSIGAVIGGLGGLFGQLLIISFYPARRVAA